MAVLSEAPTDCALVGVAGNPFDVTFNVTVQDQDGTPIDWSEVTDASVYIESGGTEQSALECSVDSSDDNVWQLSWTASQTSQMGVFTSNNFLSPLSVGSHLRWVLRASIEGDGPYSLCAGELSMYPVTTPGQASDSSINLTVTVGATAADLSVTLYGSGGGDGDVTSVFGRTGDVTAESGDYTADQVGALGATASASGDLSGSYPGPTVAALQGNAVATTAPTSGYALVWNGSEWAPASVSGSGNMSTDTYDPADIAQQVVGTTATQTLTNKTLTAPKISTISNTGTLTLPTSTDTLVGRATTDTLTNKTLTSPTLTTPVLGTPASGVLTNCTGTASGLTAGAVTGLSVASGKTLTASNSLTLAGTDSTTMTFPSTSGTVVTLAATQTLTNKTLTSPALTTPALGTPASGTLTNCTGPWVTNPMTTAGDLIIGGTSGAPTRLAVGSTSGYVLTSNGSGEAPSWQAAGSGTYLPQGLYAGGTVTTTLTLPSIATTPYSVATATTTASDTCAVTLGHAVAGQSFSLYITNPASGTVETPTFTAYSGDTLDWLSTLEWDSAASAVNIVAFECPVTGTWDASPVTSALGPAAPLQEQVLYTATSGATQTTPSPLTSPYYTIIHRKLSADLTETTPAAGNAGVSLTYWFDQPSGDSYTVTITPPTGSITWRTTGNTAPSAPGSGQRLTVVLADDGTGWNGYSLGSA